MSDKFQPISMDQLVAWVFEELKAAHSIFGIPRELFFEPAASDHFRLTLYGQALDTPFGVAAGPHTQMAQNIIAAWLCGARFIELKTVQTLDELEVSKPCIDMQDEGYNCEWSQELKIRQSFDEYLRAWVIIHALHKQLGFPGKRPGLIFNMSVGYNLDGIKKDNVQWFLKNMRDAGDLFREYAEKVYWRVPDLEEIGIPSRLSDNVCVSTMHGCPPEEIGKICHYLMKEWKLHTNVKLNPTLLGPAKVRGILNDKLGFTEIVVPDQAFGHDLKYPDAVELLKDLRAAAPKCGVEFGVKLCNTLEVVNHRGVFDPKEKMMYLSGRPHHAIAVNLAARLQKEFGGELSISFAGGADCFNAADLLRCGMKTVTTCSDILKPGGYTRILQYIDNAVSATELVGARDLEELVVKTAARVDAPQACALANLEEYAARVVEDPAYHKERFDRSRTKTERPLGFFDCIMAPCSDECPITQRVPDYMRLIRGGRQYAAVEATRRDNPMPTVLGRACNHLCENTCVRVHYDDPLAIREIKRFVMSREKEPPRRKKTAEQAARVAVIGGGPCGLSAAYFLRQAGFPVTIFEARAYCGGMVSGSIPGYRATQASIDQDMAVIKALGVDIRCNQRAGRDFTVAGLRQDGFKYIVVAAGAQKGIALGIEGEDAPGVLDGLEFLRACREGKAPDLGKRVGVIGGGDVAMDCARSAARLIDGEAFIIYRRTRAEMPAQKEEVEDLLEEGIVIKELAAPKRVIVRNGRLAALECAQMKLGEPDESGRRRPVETGEVFEEKLDSLIVAIGQQADLGFLGKEPIKLNRKGYIEVDPGTMETSAPGVFAGGDAVLGGPETIVKAFGHGKKIAREIVRRESVDAEVGSPEPEVTPDVDVVDLLRRKARREYRVKVPHLSGKDRKGFREVVGTLSETDAVREAGRCLQCDQYCSICATVCPNKAIVTYWCEPLEMELPVFKVARGQVTRLPGPMFRVDQAFQVAVLTDFCNECGNCATFCPTAGKPYRDKPRLYLNQAEFEAQTDNAFMIFSKGGVISMEAKFGGELHEFVMGEQLCYTSPRIQVLFDPETCGLISARLPDSAPDDEALELRECAQMYVLLRSITTSLPFLPTADRDDKVAGPLDR